MATKPGSLPMPTRRGPCLPAACQRGSPTAEIRLPERTACTTSLNAWAETDAKRHAGQPLPEPLAERERPPPPPRARRATERNRRNAAQGHARLRSAIQRFQRLHGNWWRSERASLPALFTSGCDDCAQAMADAVARITVALAAALLDDRRGRPAGRRYVRRGRLVAWPETPLAAAAASSLGGRTSARKDPRCRRKACCKKQREKDACRTGVRAGGTSSGRVAWRADEAWAAIFTARTRARKSRSGRTGRLCTSSWPFRSGVASSLSRPRCHGARRGGSSGRERVP